MSRLWISGYRSYELGVFNDKDPKIEIIKFALQDEIIQKIDNGIDWIISGPQLGVEQWGLETALEIKKDYPDIKIAMMLPFADFGNQWNEANKLKLADLTTQVDFSDQISDQPYTNPSQLKNFQSFMLSHTDEALFVYDEEHEGKSKYDYLAAQQFANQHPYPISMIDFDQLQEKANDFSENKRLENYEDE
ncbi:hypothetical protein FC70_GL001675 [Paucilactobacillus oligofermentans DSM 15707 = LMG 22743]|uniref:UPF0398 protein FC70_GL001675 n=1 Tax=Paucilactobacillus oligofermentans DSM 15707 = LMG 22743 TaxID=1423778 RepID=A0A0R1REV5_9LACO|nr:DUF1273 domain-containing protein [Paucilactobacillus oligofermentans]KRL54873.1 hypothetical protein FC70_GL001675 [Paucilactobacillus oligofermentans DSM 15707 = LMG 22743]CUS26212.1 UPF0398 protein [Paucilactobacillus oligofermentans DSM 15707 = LMG 22743]